MIVGVGMEMAINLNTKDVMLPQPESTSFPVVARSQTLREATHASQQQHRVPLPQIEHAPLLGIGGQAPSGGTIKDSNRSRTQHARAFGWILNLTHREAVDP